MMGWTRGRVTVAIAASATLACAAAAAEHRVVIDGMAFTPQLLGVQAGDTVTWVNKDLFVHNVTAQAFHSPDLQPGQSWRMTVPPAPKVIAYRCTLHPSMTAQLRVLAARAGAAGDRPPTPRTSTAARG